MNASLQKLKYARKLLDNVELHESDQYVRVMTPHLNN